MIRIFFGNIGCGKTTVAVRQFYKLRRRGIKNKRNGLPAPYDFYFSNFDSSLSSEVSFDGLGSWTFPPRSYIVADESGIEYNNRQFKSFPKETISWLKLSRHFKCDIDFISQSFDDMDITIRRLASELWFVKKLGPFTMLRRIYKRVGIDKETHQIVDYYEFGKLLPCFFPPPFHQHNMEIFLRLPYYKYFDSYANPGLDINPDCFYPKSYAAADSFLLQFSSWVRGLPPRAVSGITLLLSSLKSQSEEFIKKLKRK